MSKRQPIEICVACGAPFLDVYAITVGERGRRPRYCEACAPAARREQRRIQTARYRSAHPDARRETDRKYRQTPKARESAKDHRARRRAVKRGAVSEPISRRYVYDRDGGRCHLCGDIVPMDKWHMDHIVPLALGGSHTKANVAVACPSCNVRKGTRPMGEQLRIVG